MTKTEASKSADSRPFGMWGKPLWNVNVMPSVVDSRSVIQVHADEDWMAVDAAERLGYRAYSATTTTPAVDAALSAICPACGAGPDDGELVEHATDCPHFDSDATGSAA